MSFFDLRGARKAKSGWDGMAPPPLTFWQVYADLRWQNALYKNDGLPLRTRLAFSLLRIGHLVQYRRGWDAGERDV